LRLVRSRSATTPTANLVLVSPDGQQIAYTDWTFGQLASVMGAHARQLRKLPPPIAAETRMGFRAFTSATYVRIWDVEVVHAVKNINQDNRWHVPLNAHTGLNSKQAATFCTPGRDEFVFLVHGHAISSASTPGTAKSESYFRAGHLSPGKRAADRKRDSQKRRRRASARLSPTSRPGWRTRVSVAPRTHWPSELGTRGLQHRLLG